MHISQPHPRLPQWLRLACLLLLASLLPLGALAGEWAADQNGCKIWNAAPGPDETVTWSGSCKDGYASGKGTVQWFVRGKATSRDSGELREGMYHGRTTHENLRPDCGKDCTKKYVGEFIKNSMRGACGHIWFGDGDEYEGCVDEALNRTGLTKFQQQASAKRSTCEHLYVGRSVQYTLRYVNGLSSSMRGVVTGFSVQRGFASVREDSTGESREIACQRIDD